MWYSDSFHGIVLRTSFNVFASFRPFCFWWWMNRSEWKETDREIMREKKEKINDRRPKSLAYTVCVRAAAIRYRRDKSIEGLCASMRLWFFPKWKAIRYRMTSMQNQLRNKKYLLPNVLANVSESPYGHCERERKDPNSRHTHTPRSPSFYWLSIHCELCALHRSAYKFADAVEMSRYFYDSIFFMGERERTFAEHDKSVPSNEK